MSCSGVNAPADFNNPDNLALDKHGNLFITEDTRTPPGMDIWVALRGKTSSRQRSHGPLCQSDRLPGGAERHLLRPERQRLFVNVLHRGGPDPRDLGIMISRTDDNQE